MIISTLGEVGPGKDVEIHGSEQALQTGTLSLCGHINDSSEEKLVLTLVVGPSNVHQQCLTEWYIHHVKLMSSKSGHFFLLASLVPWPVAPTPSTYVQFASATGTV